MAAIRLIDNWTIKPIPSNVRIVTSARLIVDARLDHRFSDVLLPSVSQNEVHVQLPILRFPRLLRVPQAQRNETVRERDARLLGECIRACRVAWDCLCSRQELRLPRNVKTRVRVTPF